MLSAVLVLAIGSWQAGGLAAPVLEPGAVLRGEIVDGDPVVRTPALDSRLDFPTVGKRFGVVIEEGERLALELRSWYFDAYLVLRSADGTPLREDGDWTFTTHARLELVDLAPGTYLLDACALSGERGPFELERTSSAGPSHAERAIAARAEAQERMQALREQEGPECAALACFEERLGEGELLAQNFEQALAHFERALAIRERALGKEHLLTARSLERLGTARFDRGQYAGALPCLERALAVGEEALGADHPVTIQSVIRLGLVQQRLGRGQDAIRSLGRAFEYCQQHLEPDHPARAHILYYRGHVLHEQERFDEARACLEESLRIREKTFGPGHPETARGMENLAALYKDLAEYEPACALHRRALAAFEATFGPDSREVAWVLNNFGLLLTDLADFDAARPLLERSLAINEQTFGPDHPRVVGTLNNLGVLLRQQGDLDAARRVYERALESDERNHAAGNPRSTSLLNNLATVLRRQGQLEQARQLAERALAIREETLGPENTRTAQSLFTLARMLDFGGDREAARTFYERALAIRARVLGADHPDTAVAQMALANIEWQEGRTEDARMQLEAAHAVLVARAGDDHPSALGALDDLASMALDREDMERAQERTLAALRGRSRRAAGVLWSQTEAERFRFLADSHRTLDLASTLALAVEDPAFRERVYGFIREWKGLAARIFAESRRRLLASGAAAARKDIAELHRIQSRLSQLIHSRDTGDREGQARELASLRDRRNELELSIQRSIGFESAASVDLGSLRANLPEDAALLDFFVHGVWIAAPEAQHPAGYRSPDDHVSAWIVRPDRALQLVDLGLAAELETALRDYLRALDADRGVGTIASERGLKGRRLRERLWEPLAPHLAGVEIVFVSPDAFLGTLPFGALPLADGTFLLEERAFVHVQDPGELLPGSGRAPAAYPRLLALGGVDYGRPPAVEAAASEPVALRRVGGIAGFWGSLPSTSYEAQVVSDMHAARSGPEGQRLLLTGGDATEQRLKQELPLYDTLHLATHGFFQPEGSLSMWDSARAEDDPLDGSSEGRREVIGYHPGLLSGLVCANANGTTAEDPEDGLLTAEEVGWLDLSRAELVVLSACETALGEPRAGEGLIGLRRAFHLAGARTVISSVWAVQDASTSALMQLFYENLWLRRMSRLEALRAAQLAVLAKNRLEQGAPLPSTWGAFVLSGDWR